MGALMAILPVWFFEGVIVSKPDLESLKADIKAKIIERLSLDDLDLQEFQDDMPLFADGLELDSLDALEITTLIEEEYKLVIEVAERNGTVFGTINSLASFVNENYERDSARL